MAIFFSSSSQKKKSITGIKLFVWYLSLLLLVVVLGLFFFVVRRSLLIELPINLSSVYRNYFYSTPQNTIFVAKTQAIITHITNSNISPPPTRLQLAGINDTADDLSNDGDYGDSSSLVTSPSPNSPSAAAADDHDHDGSSDGSVGSGSTSDVPLLVDEEEEYCDLYSGEWVIDQEAANYPLYQPGSCPYVDDGFDCQGNGRNDSGYMKWRWKPHACQIPRFNATDFLERLRGKKLMFVGDSMNRNQFESMLCLLREALPDKSRMYETHGYKISKGRGYFIFHFKDYDCTIEFCRSHFLVREGVVVDTRGRGKSRARLHLDQIDKSSSRWKHADILVFNTGHWWSHGKTSKGKDYYQEGDFVYAHLDALEAFRRAIKTWGRWIDKKSNTQNKLIFYRGYSSAHFRGGDWDSGGTCRGEKEPILQGKALENYPVKMEIIEEVIRGMQTPVFLLNVTKLTNYRKDGHPSVYRKRMVDGQKFLSRKQDCSHWCLPGVPDTWNELIYATLVRDASKNRKPH